MIHATCSADDRRSEASKPGAMSLVTVSPLLRWRSSQRLERSYFLGNDPLNA